MKVSTELQKLLMTRMYGADVPLAFQQFTLLEWQSLMQWVLEIENAETQSVEIDMRHAPAWFCELVRGNKINAIKEVRNQLPHVITYSLNVTPREGYTFLPNLKPTKDFVEAMQNCVVVPALSNPITTSA